MMPSLGERLKAARERRNLKQTQVMEKTGISNKTISGYENGVSEPDIGTIIVLSELYDVSIDWLCGITNNPSRKSKAGEFLSSVDISDEEAFLNRKILYEGMEMTIEEKKEFFAISQGILSAKKALNKNR